MHKVAPPAGRYSTFSVCERTGLWTPRHLLRRNQIQYDWARIALQCIGLGKREYRVSCVYVEFENVASPGDVVAVPTYARADGTEYYTGLAGVRDYLRLPLLAEPLLGVADDYTDFFAGTGDDFNKMTFFAQTAGTVGVNGLSFGEGSNSVAVGIALVAAPVWADRTRDVVFGRAYFATDEQVPKAASHQIGVSWEQVFA